MKRNFFAARLIIPNIIGIVDNYETVDRYIIVKEMAEGGDLSSLIENEKCLTQNKAKKICHGIVSALSYLHEHKIAHRDIKPDNILLQSNENDEIVPKLCNFGLAKHYDDENSMKTLCGTLPYVAPEMLRNENYSNKVDCWSLGVLTFLMIGGYQPFQPKEANDEMSEKELIVNGEFSFEEECWQGISSNCKDFISSLLKPSPDERIASNQAMDHTWLTLEISNAEKPSNDVEVKCSRNCTDDDEPAEEVATTSNIPAMFWTFFAGAASGFLGGLCGIQGPPLILYFLHPPAPFSFTKESQRATGACITVTNVVVRVIYYIIESVSLKRKTYFVASDIGLYISVIVFSVIGVFVGNALFIRLKDSKQTIKGIFTLFLCICGFGLLASSFGDFW